MIANKNLFIAGLKLLKEYTIQDISKKGTNPLLRKNRNPEPIETTRFLLPQERSVIANRELSQFNHHI